MVELVTVEGPLERPLLRSIANLYGRADPKYLRDDVLDHLFVRNPAGPALHGFALDNGRPVGHCAVVPMRARRGNGELLSGKLEALYLEESHRGRPSEKQPIVLELLDRLYAHADERGIELIHALATPRIGGVIGFLPLDGVGKRTLVSLTGAQADPGPQRRHWQAFAAAQAGVRELGYAVAKIAARRPRTTTLSTPTADDADLVEGPPARPGRWTVVAADSWGWYRSSPLLRVLEIPGPDGCRALLQVPGAPGEPVRVIGWRPARSGLVPALVLLGAAGRLALHSGAPTLRFQPWDSPAGNGMLERACRLLGFIARPDVTTIWVRTHDPGLARADAVVPTPLLYVGF
jgi:hypothetical protein